MKLDRIFLSTVILPLLLLKTIQKPETSANQMDSRNLPGETEAWHKRRLAQQNLQGLQEETEVHGGKDVEQRQKERPKLTHEGTMDKANEARRDSGNSILSKKDKELDGLTMEEFIRKKLAASLKVVSAGNKDAIPTFVNGIWYPSAEYTNSFKPKSTKRS
jgi:hypothetical protein